MCADAGMLFGFLLFLLVVAASPFVIIAAVVYVVRNHRADKPTRLLD